jgi:hypothetical protein
MISHNDLEQRLRNLSIPDQAIENIHENHKDQLRSRLIRRSLSRKTNQSIATVCAVIIVFSDTLMP